MIQKDRFTSIHYACHRGNIDIVKFLLSYGADMRAMSQNGVSCLHLAAVSGNCTLVKYLIEE